MIGWFIPSGKMDRGNFDRLGCWFGRWHVDHMDGDLPHDWTNHCIRNPSNDR